MNTNARTTGLPCLSLVSRRVFRSLAVMALAIGLACTLTVPATAGLTGRGLDRDAVSSQTWSGPFSVQYSLDTLDETDPDSSYRTHTEITITGTLRPTGTVDLAISNYLDSSNQDGITCTTAASDLPATTAEGNVRPASDYGFEPGYVLEIRGDGTFTDVTTNCSDGDSYETSILNAGDQIRTCVDLGAVLGIYLGNPSADQKLFQGSTEMSCDWTPADGFYTSGSEFTSATFDLQASSDRADLVASVRGLSSKTHVGEVDMVNATVSNQGPDTATGVTLRFGTPRGTQYGYVRAPGPGWSCSVTSQRFIACTGGTLASGADATLTASLFAAKSREEKTKLAVTATSSVPDPNPENNSVVDYQKIRNAVVPKPPTAKQQAQARETGSRAIVTKALPHVSHRWMLVNEKQNVWVKVTDWFHRPTLESDDVQGVLSATMWGWEGGNHRVNQIALKMNLTIKKYTGIGDEPLTSEAFCSIPDNGGDSWCSFAHQYTWSAGYQQQVTGLKGYWRFGRAGKLNRDVKYVGKLVP